ncbi:Permuted papain-like amidase enzyme, YaeF/YiiX, C92 family [Evansella caseinilytica]|uniref:Permuted papain-like amidase enzyme, YaeF/YiiX, C92 family n=1 Tax=Evansella caseinilytica TaxID=1503961 RepID=A0A1H3S0A7_9BACI|nr:YiiX/YebB-like N1pC/P60 family cysteine hydrolase [Evansella caseinilytica]SDZ31078.1 Permuted papain-like amidase enzyme, YaeF/YiiX, C92 family [Evansella caseinilytica]
MWKFKKVAVVLMFFNIIATGSFENNNVSANETLETSYTDEDVAYYAELNNLSFEEAKTFLDSAWEEYSEYLDHWSEEIENQNKQFKDEVDELIDSSVDKDVKEAVIDLLPVLEDTNFVYNSETGEISYLEGVSTLAVNPVLGKKGNILVTLDSSSSSGYFGGHAAIVSDYSSNWTVEAFAKGFSPQSPKESGVMWQINNWRTRYKTVAGYNVKGATSTDYSKAGKYAESQIGKPYNFDFTDKKTTSSFYCSQLVWRAWKKQGYEIDGVSNGVVWPKDLTKSKNVVPFHKKGI